MSIFLLLLALPIILIIYLQTQKPKHAKINHPPPPGLPFIGNLLQYDGRLPHTYLHRLSKQYGPILSLKLGFRRVVVVSSADAMKEIIKSHDVVFSSRPAFVSVQKLSYNGINIAFSPYNEMWREMKKIFTIHLSTRKRVYSFRPIFKDEVSKMIEKIAKDVSLRNVTDLSALMKSFVSNNLCRFAFGRSYEGGSRFIDILHGTHPVVGGFFVEDYLPSFRWIDRLSGMHGKLEKKFRDIDSFCEEVIEEHMNPNRPKSMDGDIVDVMLGMIRNESPSSSSSSSFHLTLDHIKAMIFDIIGGGGDTVSIALVWAMTALMKNPSSMKKVQAEIRQLVGKKDMIEEEDIAKLPYFRAVIKETCRLYPPIPLNPRETMQKCSINGYEIEAGTLVFINAWAIGRDPKKWENPNEFMPERFMETDLDVRGQNPEVVPFGIGRRRCPGIGIAMSEIDLALANVLYKFEWELPPGMKEEDIDFEVEPGLAMPKKNALCLVAKAVLDQK